MELDIVARAENEISGNADIVNFGFAKNAPESAWIEKAETRLGFPLPISYKWFLARYAGGEVGSEEIFSIYCLDFDSAVGGDVVYQHLNGLKNGSTTDKNLVISRTDLGEIFFFDYERLSEGEAPICLRLPSGAVVDYAPNFYEFVIERISAHR